MFTELPRFFSYPKQVYVEAEVGFNNLFKVCNGIRPCSVSMYICPTENSMVVDKILFEMDSLNLNAPYRDAKKLKSFAEKKDIPYVINFSGRKGFHFFFINKPVQVYDEDSKLKVKNKIYSIQVSLREHLKLKTLDKQTIGKIKLPIRLPTSYYTSRKGIQNGNYCRNLSKEEFEMGLKHIGVLAKSPGKIPNGIKTEVTLEEISEMIPNYVYKRKYKRVEESLPDIRGGEEILGIESFGLPCLKMAVRELNPSHKMKLEMVVWLKFMGYKDGAILKFFEENPWKQFDIKKTQTQIHTIFQRIPDCEYIKEEYGKETCKNCSLERRRKSSWN